MADNTSINGDVSDTSIQATNITVSSKNVSGITASGTNVTILGTEEVPEVAAVTLKVSGEIDLNGKAIPTRDELDKKVNQADVLSAIDTSSSAPVNSSAVNGALADKQNNISAVSTVTLEPNKLYQVIVMHPFQTQFWYLGYAFYYSDAMYIMDIHNASSTRPFTYTGNVITASTWTLAVAEIGSCF